MLRNKCQRSKNSYLLKTHLLSTLLYLVVYLFTGILGGVIYFGYGIKFSNLELRIGQKATYKVGLDLDSDFDPNYGSKASRQRGYQAFENEEE